MLYMLYCYLKSNGDSNGAGGNSHSMTSAVLLETSTNVGMPLSKVFQKGEFSTPSQVEKVALPC